MNDFEIYIAVVQYDELFKVLLVSKKSDEIINEEVYEIKESTANRAIMVSLTRNLNLIEDNSIIKIYCPVNFGFKYINKLIEGKSKDRWANKDVGARLANVILKMNHRITFINYSELEETEFIKSLKPKILKKYPNYHRKTNIIEDNNEKVIYNDNRVANLDVSFYIRGTADTSSFNNTGKYISILSFNGKEKELSGKLNNATANRMIITGLIESIKILKLPCRIKLHTHTSIGLKRYSRYKDGINKDLLKEVFCLLESGNHSLEEFVGIDRQEELDSKLKTK